MMATDRVEDQTIFISGPSGVACSDDGRLAVEWDAEEPCQAPEIDDWLPKFPIRLGEFVVAKHREYLRKQRQIFKSKMPRFSASPEVQDRRRDGAIGHV